VVYGLDIDWVLDRGEDEVTDILAEPAKWGLLVFLFGIFIAMGVFMGILVIIPAMELAFRILKKMGLD
jgi:hypothetical protein